MNLSDFFHRNPSGAVAFSGGVDSSYLVWAAAKYGNNWRAYYVHGPFQPAFELRDAHRVVEQCGLPLTVLEADVLSSPDVAKNPANRCYFCKQKIFGQIRTAAAADGYSLLIDGTNASDDEEDRPGMQALRELAVRSPLRECNMTKADVRQASREAGLFTWDKPSYACLATRIPAGMPITAELLRKVEEGENLLFDMGFRNFRIRVRGEIGLIQVEQTQFHDAAERSSSIREQLSHLFPVVALDLHTRKGESYDGKQT